MYILKFTSFYIDKIFFPVIIMHTENTTMDSALEYMGMMFI